MAKYGKWIGLGLGWAVGGPIGAIGAIVGFVVGSLIDETEKENTTAPFKYSTRPADFAVSLVILAGAVFRANGKKLKIELQYIKDFFKHNYGEEKTKELLLLLRDTIDQKYSLRNVCLQIKAHMAHPGRLQLMHFLVGIAQADGNIDDKEHDTLRLIAGYLGINPKDFESVKALYIEELESAYWVLNLPQDCSDEEVKKAYRKMAVKYHPDKVAYMGEEVMKGAEEKFQQLTKAYERIKKQRSIK